VLAERAGPERGARGSALPGALSWIERRFDFLHGREVLLGKPDGAAPYAFSNLAKFKGSTDSERRARRNPENHRARGETLKLLLLSAFDFFIVTEKFAENGPSPQRFLFFDAEGTERSGPRRHEKRRTASSASACRHR